MLPIIDAHLDLAWNALSYDRDQTATIAHLREREAAMAPGAGRCRNTVSLPEMRRGGIGICLATILARCRPDWMPTGVQERTLLDVANQEIAHAHAQGQNAYYRLLEARGLLRRIKTRADLEAAWSGWSTWPNPGQTQPPIGFILSMEGCDPIVTPAQAAMWWEQGLRTASLAHYGQSAYGYGTGGDGPITPAGRELLREFSRLGMILDLTHTAETAFFQALDLFPGHVFASHNNCRALVPGDRQFSDVQIRQIIARGGVIGAVLDDWMLVPGWRKSESKRDAVSLTHVVDHIDHVCQVAGNARHAAIGSDLDGGYGTEQSPGDLETIADLQKLGPLLAAKGYAPADVAAIFHGNWLAFFRRALPMV